MNGVHTRMMKIAEDLGGSGGGHTPDPFRTMPVRIVVQTKKWKPK